jgi:hypothetical protein
MFSTIFFDAPVSAFASVSAARTVGAGFFSVAGAGAIVCGADAPVGAG